jgi:hypothetical protein
MHDLNRNELIILISMSCGIPLIAWLTIKIHKLVEKFKNKNNKGSGDLC